MLDTKKVFYILLDVIICVCLCTFFETIIGKFYSISFFSIVGIVIMVAIARDRPIQ